MCRFLIAAVVVFVGAWQVEAGLYYGPYGGKWDISYYSAMGQTFRAPGTAVGKMGFYVYPYGGASDAGLSLQLYEGSGFGGKLLATRVASTPSGQGWASAWFSGIALKAGNTYSLRVIDHAATAGEYGHWWIDNSLWGSTYAQGVSIRYGIVNYTWEDLAFFVQDPIINNGDFGTGSLTDWAASGLGSANCIYTTHSGYAAQLTAGSPIQISQSINTPSEAFQVYLDHSFQSAGVLNVSLDSILLGSIDMTEAGAWETEHLLVSNPALRGVSGANLAFEFDGVAGSRLLLDNIHIAGVPEPSTGVLLFVALAALAVFYRRRYQMA